MKVHPVSDISAKSELAEGRRLVGWTRKEGNGEKENDTSWVRKG